MAARKTGAAGGRKPLTERQRQEILKRHANKMSRNAIWRDLQGTRYACSQGAISKVVQEAGESFERAPEVKAATVAAAEDAAAIRARMELKYALLAEHIANRVVAETVYVYVDAKEGMEHRVTLPEPTAADVAKLMQASTKANEASQRQADASKDKGSSEGRSLLENIRQVAAALVDMPDPDDCDL